MDFLKRKVTPLLTLQFLLESKDSHSYNLQKALENSFFEGKPLFLDEEGYVTSLPRLPLHALSARNPALVNA